MVLVIRVAHRREVYRNVLKLNLITGVPIKAPAEDSLNVFRASWRI